MRNHGKNKNRNNTFDSHEFIHFIAESHKEFLSRCITDGLVPKGLELMLERTIGNHDQNFLDNWYSKLK